METNLLPAPFNLRLTPSWTADTGPGDLINCDLTGTDGDTICLYINGGGLEGKPAVEFLRSALPYLLQGPLRGPGGCLYTLTLKDAACGCESVPSAYGREIGGFDPANVPGWIPRTPPSVPVNLVAAAEWNGEVNGGPGYSRILLTWETLFNSPQTAVTYNVYKNGVLFLAGLTVLRAFDVLGTSVDIYTVTGVNAYLPGLLESAQSAPASCTVLTGPPAAVTLWGGIVKWVGSDDSGWATLDEPLPGGGKDVAIYKGANILSVKAAGTTGMGRAANSVLRHPLAIEAKGLNKAAPETITAVLLDKLLPYVPDTGAMLPGQMGMADKLTRTWTNGQGDPSNVPNVLATSAPYQTTLTPVVSQPGDYLKTDADYTVGAPLPMPVVTPGLPSGPPPYYGYRGDYQRQPGADIDFEQFGTALELTELFGMNAHGMVRVADGGGVGSSNPTHTTNAAAVLRLKDKSTGLPFAPLLKAGSALSFKLLTDAHNDGRGRMRLLFFPAGDTLINPGKFAKNENGNNYATLSGTCLSVIVGGSISVEYFEGGNQHDLFSPTTEAGANTWADGILLNRSGDWCPQPEINGSPNEIDKGHLFEFVFSENHYRITESTHDGMAITREKDMIGVTLPETEWQCAVSYEPYHTDLERTELLLYRQHELHWINNVPYSRVWHFDNLQFGQRTLADVGFPVIVPPVVTPPVEPAQPPVLPPEPPLPPVVPPTPPAPLPTPLSALVGDGAADDTLALQHLLDAALIDGVPLILPRGIYRITRTLLLTDPRQPVFPVAAAGYMSIYGAAITGAGPNERGGIGAGGVTIVLDNPAETAVLRIGEGVLYDTVITGVSFLSRHGAGQTTLDIPFTRWSRLRFEHCVLFGCDYAVDLHSANLVGDGNGEMLLFNNCVVSGNIAAYRNVNGMAVCHGLTDCEAGCGPGGSVFVMGNSMYGTDFAAEHIMISCDDLGPTPNTLLDLSDVEMVRFGGGRSRVEFIDTVVKYSGGTLASRGIIVVEGVNFASVPGRGPLIDGTASASGMGQNKLTFRDCSFVGKDMSQGRKGGAEGPVVLTVAYHAEDTSRWYFEGCVFENFSNIYALLACPLAEFGPGNFFCPDPASSWQDQPLTKSLIGKYASTSPIK